MVHNFLLKWILNIIKQSQCQNVLVRGSRLAEHQAPKTLGARCLVQCSKFFTRSRKARKEKNLNYKIPHKNIRKT
jgi:hypothetical protein